MNQSSHLILDILRAGLNGSPLPRDPGLDQDSWKALLQISEEQGILPLVYETVCRCQSFRTLEKDVRTSFQSRALHAVSRQITQTNEFLTLLLHAQAAGLDPIVLKGIIVRELYPAPMLRPSVDEDVLISADEAETYHRFLLSEGLYADDPGTNFDVIRERSYHKKDSPTYIELHADFFPPDSEAYADCNTLFDEALGRTITVQIEDVSVRTLAPTDHLLYLICHAYKHFLYSGIGIRQICDIGMFSRVYGREVDWNHIWEACQRIHIGYFTAAIFRITHRYLGFDMPEVFSDIEVAESDLLEDTFAGGMYGAHDIDRLHSSTMTLDAVASDRAGKRRGGVLRSVFPPAEKLQGRFPYLRRYPVLLPVAWGQRIWGYLSRKNSPATHPTRSIEIGNRRIELLKEYGIIE